MSPEDVALCQQAIELAKSGQKQAAYKQFCLIYHHGNTEDVTLLVKDGAVKNLIAPSATHFLERISYVASTRFERTTSQISHHHRLSHISMTQRDAASSEVHFRSPVQFFPRLVASCVEKLP
jgi:hypothetical protein